MKKALERLVVHKFDIATVIDVGASDGRWSIECMNSFPNARYHLIEAQKGHLKSLKKFEEDYQNGSYVLAAAGDKIGTVYFNNDNLFGGIASKNRIKNGIEVPVVTIDYEVEKHRLKPPYLIKLDTHGFEVPILEGSQDVLKNTEVVIIETYNFKITPNSLKYWEMCSYMDTLGFAPIENVDLMLRVYDNAFWQMDTIFVKTHTLFLIIIITNDESRITQNFCSNTKL